jgi:acetoacetyl-CoA synthetase
LITAFEAWLARERGLRFDHYEELWRWSVDDAEGFWSAILQFFDLRFDPPPQRMLGRSQMPNASWFPGARLNFVEQMLRHTALATPAVVYESEAMGAGELSWPELRRQVASVAATLRGLGVGEGDRVAGYLPNIPQTLVAFLAAASLGAVWTLCAPDMGPLSVGDRFRQIAPKVLVAVDGYRFAGKPFDRRAALVEILAGLPSVRAVLWVTHLDAQAEPPPTAAPLHWLPWAQAVAGEHELRPQALPPEHPLWILYSSGTTGLPKPIVHGHGGVLANGMVNMVLHNDLHPGDRVLWAVNTSWMVWNAHIMSLLGGATVVLYDGSVTGAGPEPDWGHLWRLAGRTRVQFFGAGAAIHQQCMKADVMPARIADLSALKTVGSTGSPLSPEACAWLYSAVKPELWLNVVSGGTDLAGGFLVGLPTLPVYLGEMQCRTLGARVEAWSDEARPVIDEVGELVCVNPLPSMPLYFWGDDAGARYREAYFSTFPGVWRHGDYMVINAHGGCRITGRSDRNTDCHRNPSQPSDSCGRLR